MQKTALYFKETEAQIDTPFPAISLEKLERHAEDWLFDGEYRNHAPTTIDGKRNIMKKLLWFLRAKGFQECGVSNAPVPGVCRAAATRTLVVAGATHT